MPYLFTDKTAHYLIISAFSGETIEGAHAVARYLCRLVPSSTLYGTNDLEKAEVNRYARIYMGLFHPRALVRPQIDNWLDRSLASDFATDGALKNLDSILLPRTYLVGYDVTLADLAVFAALKSAGQLICSTAILIMLPPIETQLRMAP